MDSWDKHRHYHRENPSFSSTLLDAIYRSIDESNGKEDEDMMFRREATRNNKKNKEEGNFQHKACLIEKWMEQKVSYEKVSVRRKSMADLNKKTPVLLNSSSSSSESSSGGGFSSSESESVYNLTSKSSSNYTSQRPPKPIRTSISALPEKSFIQISSEPKHETGSFVKTKSKAMKIYGGLKKVKQPISPGGRLASFLNSLFTAGNAKKANISSRNYDERKIKSEQASTCSSASSFSRSCLSKTPSSRGKLSNGTKRSVRFYPVSVIVDEDSRPCGHKNVYENHEEKTTLTSIHEEVKFCVMNESRRAEDVARDLLKNYQKKQQEELHRRNMINEEFSEEDEEEDGESYASSDLFELDNLSSIGIERYREELPVYETTHLSTNRAIANGLFL